MDAKHTDYFRSLATALTCVMGLLIVFFRLLGPRAEAMTPPRLQFLGNHAPFAVTVEGTGWPRQGRLVFSVQAGNFIRGQEVRATRDGTFRLGVTGLPACVGGVFSAVAFDGQAVKLTSFGNPACPVQRNSPTPHLHLLVGTRLRAATVAIVGSGPAQIKVSRGDKIEFRESGTPPQFMPTPDLRHFTLLAQQGTPSSVDCAPSTCETAVHTWTYVAFRPGTGLIGMEPACRQTRPQCMIAERAIRVVIR
jgi:hypothetical protein